MKWNSEDKLALLQFKDTVDSDDIRIKETIKKVLLNNRFIIHVLDNKDLEDADAEPNDYYNENIKPYYIIPNVQSSINNYICYEVDYDEEMRYNYQAKILEIRFIIMCRQDNENIIDTETKIARHDLLAALIQDQFNHTNYFGSKIMLVKDVSSTTDTDFALRTLTFRQVTDNNLVKSNLLKQSGKPNGTRLANKDVVVLGES